MVRRRLYLLTGAKLWAIVAGSHARHVARKLGYIALELSRRGGLIARSLLVGEYRVIFNNCYDCRGSTEYFIGKQRNGSEFHIECGSPQATPAC